MTSDDSDHETPGESFYTPALSEADKDEPTSYWKAQAFADTVLAEFEAARLAGETETLRERFYVLARYYRRSLAILHSALEHRREALAEASLQNLIVFQHALTAMRKVVPDAAQSTLALEADLHHRVNRDLVHRILRDASGPLRGATIVRRFNELDLIADARSPAIEEALETLVQSGHVIEREGKYSASRQPYIDADVDRAGLVMLLGPALAGRFADAGYEGLAHVLARPDEFLRLFQAETGFSVRVATLASVCATALTTPTKALHGGGTWQHADLSSSAHPRPYQRLLQAVLRAHSYAAQVIEAPAGSGKTLIGMLCIEDWLRTMAPGQSILVLVPTVNYQRQWVAELCLKQAGLQMSPTLVFAGTPAGLAVSRRRGGVLPAVLVLTYAGLSQAASGRGKGGFDRATIERFLQGNHVRHVVLDEVHKVAADLSGSEAEVIRIFREWLRDGSLSSLIGFSGTLVAFQRQLHSLGLDLAFVLPAAELIGQGWVAPFAEFGAPFNYSERERGVAAVIDEYKSLLRDYLGHMGQARLRAWFAAITLDQRVRLAARLGMYARRRDADLLISERLKRWETDGQLGLDETLLVSILQLAYGWSDRAMLGEAGASEEADSWIDKFDGLRARLRPLLPPGRLLRLLNAPGFGVHIETASFGIADREQGPRIEEPRDLLATTFAGTYLAIRTWSRQVGEGRVSAVRSIIAAERQARTVSGVIVFDNPGPLQTKVEPIIPGYRGAGGLFAHLLGDRSCVPMAALASAVYLPDYPGEPIHAQIADWLMRRVVGQAERDALFRLLAAGAELDESRVAEFRPVFERAYGKYVSALTEADHTGVRDFDQHVLQPLRDMVRDARLGRASATILNWLSRNHHHLRGSIKTILDYAAIAAAFRAARPVEAIQGDGSRVSLRVVPAPSGLRRQLFLDLTARILDSDELSVNLAVVSDWARTGWNVVSPNVLIDATATRNVIAWQQLRGRAMRPAPTWSSVAQRLVQHLLGNSDPDDAGEPGHSNAGRFSVSHLPLDELDLMEQIGRETHKSSEDGPAGREELAVSVMLERNKVTHVYELIRSYGARAQVEYNRSNRRWQRSAAIAAKHLRTDGIRPADGAYVPGPSHAPMIIVADPRSDLPGAFQARLGAELASADERIVRGWLRASARTAPVAPAEGQWSGKAD